MLEIQFLEQLAVLQPHQNINKVPHMSCRMVTRFLFWTRLIFIDLRTAGVYIWGTHPPSSEVITTWMTRGSRAICLTTPPLNGVWAAEGLRWMTRDEILTAVIPLPLVSICKSHMMPVLLICNKCRTAMLKTYSRPLNLSTSHDIITTSYFTGIYVMN